MRQRLNLGNEANRFNQCGAYCGGNVATFADSDFLPARSIALLLTMGIHKAEVHGYCTVYLRWTRGLPRTLYHTPLSLQSEVWSSLNLSIASLFSSADLMRPDTADAD